MIAIFVALCLGVLLGAVVVSLLAVNAYHRGFQDGVETAVVTARTDISARRRFG